jgi:hypothetical protein
MTFCDNTQCPRHTEYSGGRFVFHQGDKKWYCAECTKIRAVMNPGKALWDYSTTHFDGQKRYIGSLANMRKLEQQFGVSNQAANFMEGSWK